MNRSRLNLLPLALALCTALAPAGADAEESHSPAATAEGPKTFGAFRVDSDGLGVQLWAFGNHPLTDGLFFSHDVYVTGTFGEYDLGLTFVLGELSLLPMVGVGFDWARKEAVSLIAPQLFTIYSGSSWYFESWVQCFFNELFHDGDGDGYQGSTLYTRNFLLYKLGDFAPGPQFELTYDMKGEPADASGEEPSRLLSLQVGAHVDVTVGEGQTVGLFLGKELAEAGKSGDDIAGRFTYIHAW